MLISNSRGATSPIVEHNSAGAGTGTDVGLIGITHDKHRAVLMASIVCAYGTPLTKFLAGTPTAVAPLGTSLSTTALKPIIARRRRPKAKSSSGSKGMGAAAMLVALIDRHPALSARINVVSFRRKSKIWSIRTDRRASYGT